MSDFNNDSALLSFSESLSLFVPTNVCDEEFQALIKQASLINKMKLKLLKSDITFEDYLDAAEYFGVNMDQYTKEVENNLTFNLDDLHR